MPPDGLIRCLHIANAASEGVPDAELLRRSTGGRDDTAFELLVRRHAEMVWRVCRSVSRDHHAAEDAFQATFLAFSREAPVIRDSVAGWLYRVARHAALKARAQELHAEPPVALDQETAANAEPSTAVEAAELAAVVHDELGRLAEKYRLPLVLCDLEGYTHAAAARSLGWPVGTVATRVARGRTALRQRLTRRGVALSASGLAAALTAPPVSALPPLLPAATVRSIGTNAVPPTIHMLAHGAVVAMTRTKRVLVLTSAVVIALAGATAVTFASKADPSETTEKAPPDPPKVPDDGAPLSAVVVVHGPAGPRVVTFRSAERIAALEKCFPNYRKRPGSFNKGGWEACHEIYFNFPRGNTVRLTASDERNDPPAWSAGMGDFPLSREFYKLVAAAGNPGATAPGNWSTEVNGLKARLILERAAPSNGTPIIKAYIELHNVSGVAAPIQLALGSTKRTWSVTDRDGNEVPHTSLPGNELPGDPAAPLVIPNGATLRLVVSKTASGIPKDRAAHLDLGLERTWVFDRGDGKEYFLGGKLEVRDNRFGLWEGTVDLPKVRIPIASP